MSWTGCSGEEKANTVCRLSGRSAEQQGRSRRVGRALPTPRVGARTIAEEVRKQEKKQDSCVPAGHSESGDSLPSKATPQGLTFHPACCSLCQSFIFFHGCIMFYREANLYLVLPVTTEAAPAGTGHLLRQCPSLKGIQHFTKHSVPCCY